MIAELIERLEKAEGSDREIDHAITDAFAYFFPFQPDPYSWRTKVGDKYFDTERFGRGGSTSDRYVPKYTSSLDAALSLVERKLPGVHWSISNATVKPRANVWMPQPTRPIMGPYSSGATPALAVCLALLRSLSTEA